MVKKILCTSGVVTVDFKISYHTVDNFLNYKNVSVLHFMCGKEGKTRSRSIRNVSKRKQNVNGQLTFILKSVHHLKM